jgi:hypothetical protein
MRRGDGRRNRNEHSIEKRTRVVDDKALPTEIIERESCKPLRSS